MDSTYFTADAAAPDAVITRVTPTQWLAEAGGAVVGSGDVSRRPGPRQFVSIDAWQPKVFDQLAAAMTPALPRPLYTLVDAAHADVVSHWERAGFVVRRREWECLLETGNARYAPPPGVRIEGFGQADEDRIRELDRAIRAEVDADLGWHEMPFEFFGPDAPGALDPAKYAIATTGGEYVGLIRVVHVARQAKIGLLAVRREHQRQGIGRALLAHALDALHARGIDTVFVEVNEANPAAVAQFAGARRISSNLELVLR